MLMDDEFEFLAFPDMFPYGTGGYCTAGTWNTKLSLSKIFSTMVTECWWMLCKQHWILILCKYATDIKQIKSWLKLSIAFKAWSNTWW